MSDSRVNYDEISGTYDHRYEANPMPTVAAEIRALADGHDARRVLEVGCGTGRWLAELATPGRLLAGLDASRGMLRGAQGRGVAMRLVHGVAEALPFPAASFDLLYVVNALHHFPDKRRFIREAARVLPPGGLVAVIGMRPANRADWYVYEYFEGVYETDLARYPAPGELRGWLSAVGFERAADRIVYDIQEHFTGREVFEHPFIQKDSTSQLVLLSDAEYEAGLRHIEQAIRQAEAAGEPITFTSSLQLVMVTAQLPAGG